MDNERAGLVDLDQYVADANVLAGVGVPPSGIAHALGVKTATHRKRTSAARRVKVTTAYQYMTRHEAEAFKASRKALAEAHRRARTASDRPDAT